MNEFLVSAFGLGLLGSLHCVGMCGPIALALPATKRSRTALLLHRLSYNGGRLVTYSILGAVVGLVGQMIVMGGWQQSLSIVAGVGILLTLVTKHIVPSAIQRTNPTHLLLRFSLWMRSHWSRLFAAPKSSALFGIGLLNGFLPCGLLYVALASAATSGTWLGGALFMSCFALATIPALLAVSYMGSLLPNRMRSLSGRLIPVGALIMALLLILRGLSLGIPYLSPHLESRAAESPRTVHDCCK